MEKVLDKLKATRTTLHAAQTKHRENHNKCLRDALKEKEKEIKDADDLKKAKKAAAAIESLIQKHCTEESYKQIKQVVCPNSSGGLQRVDVPKKDAEGNAIRDEAGEEVCEVLLEVNDIHKAILEQNKKHFHQADKTPFAGGAENTVLYDLIRYTGMSQAAKDVVDGTFLAKYGDELGHILPKTEQVIRELSMPEEIKVLGKKIDTEILEEDFISGFKGWKESTSTSPSGRHLGHYKAIVNDLDLKKQDPAKSHLQERETNFVSSLIKLLNIPIKYGFAPKRWCTSVTVMIEKDPGNPQIERLCVIHLFEADYNLSLKLLWGKQMVYQGEDNNCFGKQQHGSQPLHQAINPVHLKTLTYDLTRILRTSLIMFDNDATGCLDRIIVSLAMIAAL
jgi:hypothetical protein